MLYGIGIIVLLFATAIESESLIVPLAVAFIGITLMAIGGNDGEADTER